MSASLKPTAGPWEFIDSTKQARYRYAPTCVIKSGKVQIAEFSWNDNSDYFPSKEESQANALLIAAAPSLLEALRNFTDGRNISYVDALAEARRAIELAA